MPVFSHSLGRDRTTYHSGVDAPDRGAAKRRKFEAGFVPLPNAIPCQLPPDSRLRDSLPRVDYLDSFEVPSRTPEQDVVVIYAAALGHLPTVLKHLLVVRSHLVKPVGITGVSYGDLARPIDTERSYAVGDKFGCWTLFAKHRDEIITGKDDKHLDFRVSVFRDARPHRCDPWLEPIYRLRL
jgi:hypothetical protein